MNEGWKDLGKKKTHYFISRMVCIRNRSSQLYQGISQRKVRFYSDSHFSKPLRSWEKFLGHSKPVSIIISKPKTELEQKLEWFTYKGSGAILSV